MMTLLSLRFGLVEAIHSPKNILTIPSLSLSPIKESMYQYRIEPDGKCEVFMSILIP